GHHLLFQGWRLLAREQDQQQREPRESRQLHASRLLDLREAVAAHRGLLEAPLEQIAARLREALRDGLAARLRDRVGSVRALAARDVRRAERRRRGIRARLRERLVGARRRRAVLADVLGQALADVRGDALLEVRRVVVARL